MSSEDIPKKTSETLKTGFHVQVILINQISNTKEPKATISSRTLAQYRDLTSMLLRDLRRTLGKRVDSKWTFCLENCAPVEEADALLYYLTLDDSNVNKLQPPPPAKPDQESPEAPALPVLSTYMTVGNAMAPAPKGFGAEWAEKHKADLSLSDRSKSEIGAPALSANHKAEYVKEDAWAKAGSNPTAPGMLDCVVDFADADWDKLMMLNKVLYAFDVRGKKLEVTSARLPAFELQGRLGNAQLKDLHDDLEPVHLRPFVEIFDTPNIDIAEISSEFQTSLVDNAFSSKSLEAMASGGSPMINASVSAGVKSEVSKGSGSSEGGQKREYHATYNFPRVKLFLDESTLTVSKYCDNAIMALKSNPTFEGLRQFQRQFGVIFAQEVMLGGRLESSKAADSQSSAANSSAKDAFKASLGAAFSYGPASASASATSEDQSSHETNANKQQGRSAISYTARGGDTLLCADPAAWAATVAVWRNWRVVLQDEPVTLQELLGRFKEYKFVPDLFASILEANPSALKNPDPGPVPPKIFDVNKNWTENTDIQLWISQDRIPSMSMAVRDGDPNNEGAGPRQSLNADYPLLLFTPPTHKFPGRDASTVYVDKATGILGPQSDLKGPYRFSFRKVGRTGTWQPLSSLALVNGEQVTWWCHTLGRGGWTSLDKPPSDAYQAYFNKTTKDLKFETDSVKLSAVVGYEPATFNVEFV